MRPATRPRLIAVLAFLLTASAFATNAVAQTFTIAPGSPTVPAAGPPNCGPPFSPFGDILQGPPFFPPLTSVVRMGPPGCGLGWPGPLAPANVDGFSTGLFPIPPLPMPAGAVSFLIGVDGAATGFGGPLCALPATPGPFPPDVGSEACAQPATSDAAADIFMTVAAGAPPLPGFVPGSMPNFQISDGNGLPAAVCAFPPAAGVGLVEPVPGGDNRDEFDGAPLGAWLAAGGLPAVPVYYSVDAPTGAAGGFLPAAVIVKPPGAAAIAVYAPPVALGLDLIGGPGSDDIDALAVYDVAAPPLIYAPGPDIVLFSLTPGSATVGTPNPCPGPLAGAPRAADDILTEGTPLGAPGAACILVPAENMNLWTMRSCGPNPLTGAGDDNLDSLEVAPPAPPPPTVTPTPGGSTATPTRTATPGGATATPTRTAVATTTATTTPGGATATPTLTSTPAGPIATPTATSTPVAPTATMTAAATVTPTPDPVPTCGAGPIAGCRTPSVSAKAILLIKDKMPDDKDLLVWKWIKGSVTMKADFGTPLTTTSYQLCVYDGTPTLILDATMPAGGMCNVAKPKPCWQDKTKGFNYNDKDRTPDGIQKLILREGLLAGKAKIILKGKASLLDDPTIPLAGSPVTVQLLHSGGACWEAVYTSPYLKNTFGPPPQFKDKAD